MTKPRWSDPEKLERARQVAASTAGIRDHIALTQAHPRRLVKHPCGDTTCPNCYGTEEESEHVRQTGMMPGEGHPIPDPGAQDAFTQPEPS